MSIDELPVENQVFSEQDGAWQVLSQMLPVADWTADANAGRIEHAVDPCRHGESEETDRVTDPFDAMARSLYRRNRRHVIVTGLDGVGKTCFVREFARRAAAGAIPYLKNARFLWIGCGNVGPEDSRACLETIVTSVAGRANVVLCLDNLDALLKRPSGGSNKPLLGAVAGRADIQIIGIMSKWSYEDLIGGDAQMLKLFDRIEIEEPGEDAVLEIVGQAAARFEREFPLKISDQVVRRTVVLSSNFMLNANDPAKSVNLLQQVCEDADYERTQLGSQRSEVTTADVIRTIAETTGIPEATIAGQDGEADFESALRVAVVGQDAAVSAVAGELRLIKAGLSDPGKPACVMLFAGMTGVGKTELAKRIAELYSTSNRLQTFTMGNFTEAHSVSGIIGVPPGYVGHEHGGRLINELNADPYSVFLLDEAEKAHPNVWKPFLNLFDEGWIVDQRGVKAHADRSIFILTTNAGGDAIAQMTRTGKSEMEIEERIKQTLSKIRHERSSQPVFTPQFLARLKRIIVFQALDEQAMIGIARRAIAQMQSLWQQKREKTILVPDELIELIGRCAHTLNEQARGTEGGRIVRKLVSDRIESRIQQEATRHPAAYKNGTVIELAVLPHSPDEESVPDPQPQISVTFREPG